MKTASLDKRISAWLLQTLKSVPAEANLISLDWNESSRGRGRSKEKVVLLSMGAFVHPDDEPFDPEDPDHLDLLSEPIWESSDACDIPQTTAEEVNLYDALGRLLRAKEIRPRLKGLAVAFGEHEGDMKVVGPTRKPAPSTATQPFFYELHVEGSGNFISDYETGDFDETPLLEHERVPKWPKKGIRLQLQKRPRLKDFLHFYRDWLVCSERMTNLFRQATRKIQVFPAPLHEGDKPVAGYFVVNLFEKLNCLPDEDLRPSPFAGAPAEFDPTRGYRIVRSKVKEKQVFRINYEYFRLVVSQEFRDLLEREKITGVGWLKRRSMP